MPPHNPDAAVLRTIAPAKINWTLEVLGRRPDGYHEIRSVMQTIALADSLELRPSSRFALEIEGREAVAVPAADNLVAKAAQAFPAYFESAPVAFRLRKRVPAAAGLGGGSSDAAAALRLLGRYWRIDDPGELTRIAATLGSDVPFFLRGGSQLAAGRGERLTVLPAPPALTLIIATPPITLADKTARLYGRLHPGLFSAGEASERLAEKLMNGASPSIDDCVNVFDAVADAAFPDLAKYRRTFQRVTGERAVLAGAGPSLFTIRADIDHDAGDRGAGAELRAILGRRGFKAWCVRTTGSSAATRGER